MTIKAFLRDQRGSAITLFAVFLMVGVGFAAIVIDGGYLYSLKSKLQVAADAAVLVAVSELSDTDEAREAAIVMAGKNMPPGEHGAVLASADVVTGNWDTGNRTFTAGGTPLNAVRVVTRRSQVNGNAAGLFFAQILGFGSVDIETSAIALLPPSDDCFSRGLMVGGQITFNKNSVVGGDLCVFARKGMHFFRDSTVEEGSLIASPNLADITYDKGFSAPDGALIEAEYDLDAAKNTEGIISQIEAGDLGDLPDQITRVEQVDSLPDVLVTGTAYVVNGDALIDKNITGTDVIVAVRGTLSWGQNGVILNSAGECGEGDIGIGIIATGDVVINQNSRSDGVSLVVGGNFTLHQAGDFKGSIMVAGDATINQSPELGGCQSPFGDSESGGQSNARLVM